MQPLPSSAWQFSRHTSRIGASFTLEHFPDLCLGVAVLVLFWLGFLVLRASSCRVYPVLPVVQWECSCLLKFPLISDQSMRLTKVELR